MDKNGGSFIEYVKRGVTCKRLKHLQAVITGSICLKLTMAKKKLFWMSIYRPPNYSILDTFFNEITISLTKLSLNFENFIIMGDFNIDMSTASPVN